MDLEGISSTESELDLNDFEEDAVPVTLTYFDPDKCYVSPGDDTSDDTSGVTSDDTSDDDEEERSEKNALNSRAIMGDTGIKKSEASQNPEADPVSILSNVAAASHNISATSSILSIAINSLNEKLGCIVLSQFVKHVQRQSTAVVDYCAIAKLKHDFLESTDDSGANSLPDFLIRRQKKEFLNDLEEIFQKQKRATEKNIENITLRMSGRQSAEDLSTEPVNQLLGPLESKDLVNMQGEVAQEITALSKFLHESAAMTEGAYDSEATVADDIEFPEELDTDEYVARAIYARVCTNICERRLELAGGLYKRVRNVTPNTQDTCARCVPLVNVHQRKYFIRTYRLDLVLPIGLPLTSLKCGCQQAPPCLLCTGRKNPTQPRSVATQKKQIALLDTGFHPALSQYNSKNSDIALEDFAANSKWQHNFKRVSAKTTLRKIIKKMEALNSGPPRIKRKYVKRKDKKDGVQMESSATSTVMMDDKPKESNDGYSDGLVMDANLAEWNTEGNLDAAKRYYNPQELGIRPNEDISPQNQAEENEVGEMEVTECCYSPQELEVGAYEDIQEQPEDCEAGMADVVGFVSHRY